MENYGDLARRIKEMDRPSPRLENFVRLIERRKRKWDELGMCITYLEDLAASEQVAMFYFGGFLRDLWLGMEPRDIDIVTMSASGNPLEKLIPDKIVRKNRFGGIKLEVEGVSVDAWDVYGTSAFSEGIVAPASITVLPETTFFTLEGITLQAYPGEERWGYEKGFFDTCERKEIEVQNLNNPFPRLQLVRSYELRRKLGWNAGRKLKEFIRDQLPLYDAEGMAEDYAHHYGKEFDGQKIYEGLLEMQGQ